MTADEIVTTILAEHGHAYVNTENILIDARIAPAQFEAIVGQARAEGVLTRVSHHDGATYANHPNNWTACRSRAGYCNIVAYKPLDWHPLDHGAVTPATAAATR